MFPSSPTCSSNFLSEEMVSANQISGPVNIQKVQDDIVKLWNIVKSQPEISEEQKHCIKALYDGMLHLLHKSPDSCLHWCPWKPSSIISVLMPAYLYHPQGRVPPLACMMESQLPVSLPQPTSTPSPHSPFIIFLLCCCHSCPFDGKHQALIG